ncbi:MAG: radical SAM protein [Thermoprotei archaeon]
MFKAGLGRPNIKEVKCSTLLHKMYNSLGYPEYTLNPYRGCLHGCIYCYAPSLIHDERPWGEYVDVKVNAPEILEKEIKKVPRGVVFLSSASDPYQPVEAKYGLTRSCLKILLEHDFPVNILTRSHLVLRDVDLFKRFKWLRVGMSITSVPTKMFEPRVPPLERRIETLKHLSSEGITTWVSLSPIIPNLFMVDIHKLLKLLKDAGVAAIHTGVLRFEGYEASRKMFEEKTGVTYFGAVLGSHSVMRKVDELIRLYGFDTTTTIFTWRDNNSLERYIIP